MGKYGNLSAYNMLMFYDSVFAVTKGITCYALLYMLTDSAKWPAYIIPVHAALNLIENLFTVITIERFKRTENVSSLVYALPIVSTMKWALAIVNTGSIPVLALYRGFQTISK